jgi:hypothetical protein
MGRTADQTEQQKRCKHEFILVPVDPATGERILTGAPSSQNFAAAAYCIHCGADGDSSTTEKREGN